MAKTLDAKGGGGLRTNMHEEGERLERYRAVRARIAELLDGETDWIAALSTVVCELHGEFSHYDWTGFYRAASNDVLVVGPYQGGHGCLRIPFSRGVCGAAARTRTTQRVDQVADRADHIACSSSTQSEIVVPVLAPTGEVLAVLDVDSDQEAAFDDTDQRELELLCRDLGARFPKGELGRSARPNEAAPAPVATAAQGGAPFLVRELSQTDRDGLIAMWAALWPEETPGQHAPDVDARLAGNPVSTMPLATFVAEAAPGTLMGFVEVGLRSHANGCDPSRPVAYLEGLYVAPEWRRRGVGRALVQRSEAWGRAQGAVEMASDTWLDASVSEATHLALGFEVADRCIDFAKRL